MRRACIDIGSNTTRLLVADVHPGAECVLAAVAEERAYTRIGVALGHDGTIPAAKRAEVSSVVLAQLERARALGAERVIGVGTAAIRQAGNGDAFLAELRDRTGLQVRCLAPAEEARLAFRGATAARPDAADPGVLVGVLDVGGGSSEIAVGTPGGEVRWWASLPIGSGSLAARHLRHDPPHPDELAGVLAAVREACDAADLAGPSPARTLAVGGSATSLRRLAGDRLDPPSLDRALAELRERTAAEIAEAHAIAPERARLLPAGLVVLRELGTRLGAPLEVGRGGIREGVLLEAGDR